MSAPEEPLWTHLRLKEVQAFVERLMFHPVLQDERILPVVSQLQLFLGALVLSQTELSTAVRDRVLAAMLLMHHGLELHERIQDTAAPQSKKGQLTILGGAFFSSLFYRLLMEANRIDLVSAFSQAVAQINEAKCSLEEQPHYLVKDEASYLMHRRTVQGGLLEALCEAFPPDSRSRELVDAAVMASVYDVELHHNSLQQSKGISLSRLYQGFSETLDHLHRLSSDILGAESWLTVKSLFVTSSGMADRVRVGEGG